MTDWKPGDSLEVACEHLEPLRDHVCIDCWQRRAKALDALREALNVDFINLHKKLAKAEQRAEEANDGRSRAHQREDEVSGALLAAGADSTMTKVGVIKALFQRAEEAERECDDLKLKDVFGCQKHEGTIEELRAALEMAKENIGVPQPGYPAPVVEAYQQIERALASDGSAVAAVLRAAPRELEGAKAAIRVQAIIQENKEARIAELEKENAELRKRVEKAEQRTEEKE